MKKFNWQLFSIYIVTVLAIILSIPENIPLNFHLGSVNINRVTKSARIIIPFLYIDKPIMTRLGLDLKGGTQLVLEADMSQVAQQSRTNALESVHEVVERRVNFFGISEPNVQTSQTGENYRVIVELPGISDINEALNTLGATARLEFREFKEESTSSAYFAAIENTNPVNITGADLKKAEVAFDSTTGEPIVSFELTEDGGKKFAEVSTRLVDKRLAIFLDDFPLSAPYVKNPITDGRGIISGGFDAASAKKLALQLSAGALPTPIKVIEQKNIGATLGQESITKSVRAGLIGLTLVALFMLLRYGKMGFIADIALIIYGLWSYALFRLIPVTLTLPGIAGFILSIGMAVDSNILIFERMKEELRKGKPWFVSMELGFGRAWDSIRDANFTTIMTGLILYNPLNWNFLPLSGMVRGFALTLLIGVAVSLFTGIIVTRNFMRMWYRPKVDKLPNK